MFWVSFCTYNRIRDIFLADFYKSANIKVAKEHMVNVDENIFPVYIQLIETTGSKTDTLLKELNTKITAQELSDYIKIISVIGGVDDNSMITLKINTLVTEPANPVNGQLLVFVDNLFKEYRNKYPSYVGPPE